MSRTHGAIERSCRRLVNRVNITLKGWIMPVTGYPWQVLSRISISHNRGAWAEVHLLPYRWKTPISSNLWGCITLPAGSVKWPTGTLWIRSKYLQRIIFWMQDICQKDILVQRINSDLKIPSAPRILKKKSFHFLKLTQVLARNVLKISTLASKNRVKISKIVVARLFKHENWSYGFLVPRKTPSWGLVL